MSSSTLCSRRTTDWALFILLIVCWLLWFEGQRLNRQIARLENQIEILDEETEAIETQLPALRSVSEEVVSKVIPGLAPSKNTAEWSNYLVHFPYTSKQFKKSCRIKEPKLPAALKIPQSLRMTGSHVHPGLAPFDLQIECTGNLQEIAYYLSEIDRQYRRVIVTELDFTRIDADLFSGTATLTFPRIFYAEDIERIQAFITALPQSSPTQTAGLNASALKQYL